MLTEKEKRILQYLQDEFPLEEEPFAHAAGLFRMSEAELLRLLAGLKRRKVIRYLGGIFNPAKIGVRSALCAMDVPASEVERTAAVVSGFRQVSHNYLRSGHPNLWFTLSASSDAGLQRLRRQIERRTGSAPLFLPVVRTFKIDARFPLGASRMGAGRFFPAPRGKSRINRKLIIELNKPLEITRTPFAPVAARLRLPEPRVRVLVRRYLDAGILRRFGLVLNHGEAGFTSNCMVAWNVAPGRVERAAGVFRNSERITHCYERVTHAQWRYNLYTMLHCRSKRECENRIRELARAAGVSDYAALFTEKEFKKTKADLAAIL